MTQNEIYEAYLTWLEDSMPKPFSELFEFPLINCNIFEDTNRLVNWLFYIIPAFSNHLLKCFIFFEENEFQKDNYGNLHLVSSSLHLMDS